MAEKEFLLDLEAGVRMRCWHRTERGQVAAFAVQMEIFVGDCWEPVVRFDTAHGFAHRDLYRRSGEPIKTPLGMDFRRARTFAQEDILANWRRYRDLFLGR
jgi:hypothetical protein